MKKNSGFTLIELMIVVAIIGILAAVAIPAFIKYIRKSKTVEAVEALDKVKVGARQYFVADHWLTTGTLASRQFPVGSAGALTPTAACCTVGGKCMTATSVWDAANWGPLHFALTEPHYYQYTFITANTGNASIYTATAQGDLDCDTSLSTFEIRGSVDSEGSVVMVGPIITAEIE